MSQPSPHELEGLLGLSLAALVLLDRTGRVQYCNPAAQRMFAQQAIVSIKDGLLCARRKDEDRVIQDALVTLSTVGATGSVCLRSREGFPVILIDLCLLESGRIATRLTDLTARPSPSMDRMKSVIGLTRAEARVATAMLSGLGLTGVAGKHGVESETVRSQAKRIRAKAGARSQNQLLGILTAVGPGFDTSKA